MPIVRIISVVRSSTAASATSPYRIEQPRLHVVDGHHASVTLTNQFLAHQRLMNSSEHTIRGHRWSLSHLGERLDPKWFADCTYVDIEAWLAEFRTP